MITTQLDPQPQGLSVRQLLDAMLLPWDDGKANVGTSPNKTKTSGRKPRKPGPDLSTRSSLAKIILDYTVEDPGTYWAQDFWAKPPTSGIGLLDLYFSGGLLRDFVCYHTELWHPVLKTAKELKAVSRAKLVDDYVGQLLAAGQIRRQLECILARRPKIDSASIHTLVTGYMASCAMCNRAAFASMERRSAPSSDLQRMARLALNLVLIIKDIELARRVLEQEGGHYEGVARGARVVSNSSTLSGLSDTTNVTTAGSASDILSEAQPVLAATHSRDQVVAFAVGQIEIPAKGVCVLVLYELQSKFYFQFVRINNIIYYSRTWAADMLARSPQNGPSPYRPQGEGRIRAMLTAKLRLLRDKEALPLRDCGRGSQTEVVT